MTLAPTIEPGKRTFINAKILPPTPPPAIIPREKFNDVLGDMAPVSLILVQAPAGYGKTTAVAERLEALKTSAAWYRLDEPDNTPSQFAAYLAKTLENHRPGSCPDTLKTLLEQGYGDLRSFLTDLLAELPLEAAPLYLVLDDFHRITNPDIHETIRFLLRHQPPYLKLLMLTRTQPPIGTAQLRMQGRMLEITARELGFDPDEAERYFESRLPYEVSRESIERAVRRVEGWVSALQLLATRASTNPEFNDFIAQFEHGNQYVFDYFEELMGQQIREEEISFLLRTSILDRFNAYLVMKVAGYSDGQELLNNLLGRGLFVMPLDSSGLWFRYHPLFGAYLRHILACSASGDEPALHQRASDAWRELGKHEDAARHAVYARDPERIRSILLDQGRTFFTEGHFSLLQLCLDALNPALIADEPMLTLLRAWVAQSQYQFADVEAWLAAAEERLKETLSADDLHSMRGEFSAVRAQVAMNYGDSRAARQLAEEAVALDGRFLPTSKVAAASVMGEALFVEGHLDEALTRMQDTEHLARAHGAHQNVLWALCQQSEISVAQGLLQKAYNTQERAFQYAEENAVNLPILEFLYRIRSQIMWEWHHLENAERCALKGIEILEAQGERWHVQSYTSLAKVAQARGRQTLCADYIQKIRKMLAAGDYHIDWVANSHATMLSFWDAVRDYDSIQRWLTAAPTYSIQDASNHFLQCNARNWARAYLSLEQPDKALPILEGLQAVAEKYGLQTDLNRNHIAQAHLFWLKEDREQALAHMTKALQLASTTGAVGSFLRIGKVLIVILKALTGENRLTGMELQRAERLIQMAQQQRDFSRAIRISLDEAIIQDIIDRPDVPELIRTSPLTRREWQILSLIHAGLSNDQIAEQLKVAATTVKTHIRSLYQKQNISHRSEAIALARDLLSKIQGE